MWVDQECNLIPGCFSYQLSIHSQLRLFEVVFHFIVLGRLPFFLRSSSISFWGCLSSWVKIRLHTENQLPRLSGSALKVPGWWVGSYPLLSQAPTPVEVELGCDNKKHNSKAGFDFSTLQVQNETCCKWFWKPESTQPQDFSCSQSRQREVALHERKFGRSWQVGQCWSFVARLGKA